MSEVKSMAKYNDGVIDEMIGQFTHQVSANDLISALDTLKRAPWWEEVSAGYVFEKGEPLRVEGEKIATEMRAVAQFPVTQREINSSGRHFRNTRWISPYPKPEVGSTITTIEELLRAPSGAALRLTTGQLALWDVAGMRLMFTNGGYDRDLRQFPLRYFPVTVIALSEVQWKEEGE